MIGRYQSFQQAASAHGRSGGATTLGDKPTGAEVNLEVDLIGKYVEKLLAGRSSADGGPGTLTMDKLRENGFV